jgi:hypothetical protein
LAAFLPVIFNYSHRVGLMRYAWTLLLAGLALQSVGPRTVSGQAMEVRPLHEATWRSIEATPVLPAALRPTSRTAEPAPGLAALVESSRPNWLIPLMGAVVGGAYGAYLYSDRCAHNEDCFYTALPVIGISAVGGLVLGALIEWIIPE